MTEPEDLRKVAEGLGLAGDHYVPGQVAAILARLQADREEIERLQNLVGSVIPAPLIHALRLCGMPEKADAASWVCALNQRAEAAERTVRSLAYMLGWNNVPPQETLERSVNALNARVRDLSAKVASLEKEREEANEARRPCPCGTDDFSVVEAIKRGRCYNCRQRDEEVVRAEGKREGIEAALEEILERHKGSEEPSSGHPEADAFLACRECGYKPSPCDAARVAKAMLGVVEALARASQDLGEKK